MHPASQGGPPHPVLWPAQPQAAPCGPTGASHGVEGAARSPAAAGGGAGGCLMPRASRAVLGSLLLLGGSTPRVLGLGCTRCCLHATQHLPFPARPTPTAPGVGGLGMKQKSMERGEREIVMVLSPSIWTTSPSHWSTKLQFGCDGGLNSSPNRQSQKLQESEKSPIKWRRTKTLKTCTKHPARGKRLRPLTPEHTQPAQPLLQTTRRPSGRALPTSACILGQWGALGAY